jgi:hypothetical protein
MLRVSTLDVDPEYPVCATRIEQQRELFAADPSETKE